MAEQTLKVDVHFSQRLTLGPVDCHSIGEFEWVLFSTGNLTGCSCSEYELLNVVGYLTAIFTNGYMIWMDVFNSSCSSIHHLA